LIDPPAIYNDLGQILVCAPTRPHMHKFHVAHRVVHFIGRPSVRHHPHHRRICHAHVHCHWEDVLGGPAGAWPSQDELPELDAGSGLGGDYGGSGGGFFGGGGGGFGTGLFVPIAATPLDRQTVDQGPPNTPPPAPPFIPPLAPPPPMAIPEPSTWAMMLTGFLGLFYAATRRARWPI
jgi:hypothetical protein